MISGKQVSKKPFTKKFSSGTFLFRENDHSRELYIIQTGKVKVFRSFGQREIELAILGNGAVLGEMSLIDGKPRSASAKAIEPCSVVFVDADTFSSKAQNTPPWFLTIIRIVSDKIRKANLRLQKAHQEQAGISIVLTLHHFFNRYGTESGGSAASPSVNLRSTPNRIIQLLNVSYQDVIQIFNFLQNNDFIAIQNDKIDCGDFGRYDEYCGYLRQYMRKSFRRVEAVPEEVVNLLNATVRHVPSIMGSESSQVEIQGGDFETICNQLKFTDDKRMLVDRLKQMNLCTIKKIDRENKKEDSLEGIVLYINSVEWKRYVLHYRYSNLIPIV